MLARLAALLWAPLLLAADAVRMRLVRVGPSELAYVERGRGEPMLLIHGGMQDLRLWDGVARRLDRRFRTIAYSRRNHWPGAVSAHGVPDGAADLHADDMAALVRGLGLARVHVVAHSAGAHAALFFAARHSALVASLVVNEPPAAGLLATPAERALLAEFQAGLRPATDAFRAGDHEAGMRAFADAVGGPGGYARRTAAQRAMMRDNVLAHVADATSGRPRPVFDCAMARSITAPVLITRGDRSPAFFHAVADALGRCLPDADRKTLAGHHNLPGENPADFAGAVDSFLLNRAPRLSP